MSTPKAVRVRTSDGWQDIAMQGPQGIPGLTLAAFISFGATFTGAETTGQATELVDVGGIGVVSGTDYQITRGGTYVIIPTMESINMNVNTTAQALLRRNPAGANEWLTAAYPSAALQSAGAQRLLAGLPIIKDLAAGDILRGRVSHSETGVSRTVNLYLTLFLIGSGLSAPQVFNDIYCQLVQGNRPQQSIPHNAWTLMQIPAIPQIVISRADGSNDDFTRNADGSITINKSGVYHMNASITADEPLSDGSNVNLVILKKAGATPTAIPGDILGGIFNVNSGGTTNQYPGGVVAADQYCLAGDRIAFYVYCFAGGAVARLFKLHSFGIHRTGVGSQGPPGPSTPIPLVISLPSSPVDGQEIYYLADATNGIIWHLRYRASSPSIYKWEAVSQPSPLYQEITGGMTVTSGSYIDTSTPGPLITVPLAGDYNASLYVEAVISAGYVGSQTARAAVKKGTAATSDDDSVEIWNNDGSGRAVSASRPVIRCLGIAANAQLKVQYRVGGQTWDFLNRRLGVTPVRVG